MLKIFLPSLLLFVSELLHDSLQYLTFDLILSTNTVSATVEGEEDFITRREGRAVPRRILAADSCALDRYDMPVIQIQINNNHRSLKKRQPSACTSTHDPPTPKKVQRG